MNSIRVHTRGGGIFSLYHIALIQLYNEYTNNIDDICSFQILIDDNHIFNNKLMFDDFFEYDESFIKSDKIELKQDVGTIYYKTTDYLPEVVNKLKKIINKNRINKKIDNTISNFIKNCNLSSKTLCVHIRLTDMNVIHQNYGVKTFNDYKREIDNFLKLYIEIDSIFIASDNDESIKKIVEIYNDKTYNDIKLKVISYENKFRTPFENSDNYNYIIETANKFPEYPVEIFTEVLLASKCGYFIGRKSSISFFIVLYSENFKEITYLN